MSYPRSNEFLKEVRDAELEARENRKTLDECEALLEALDRNDPDRLTVMKKVTTFRLTLARDETKMAVLKAQAGIVGESWYNKEGGDVS